MHPKNLFIYLFFLSTFLGFGQEVYHPEAERINNLEHTKLKVSFNYENQTMPGEAWITLKPHFYPTDSLSLNAQSMLIHDVALVKNGKNSKINYEYKNDLLRIDLDKTYKKDEEYTVYIKYTAQPEKVAAAGGSAISDAKGLYFINPKGEDPNKPIQIWTQGEPTSSSAWFPTIDELNQKTSQELYMTVPSEYVTLSNGVLVKQTQNNDNTRTDYWKQTLKHAPYLFFMGVGDFAVIKDKWKNIPVDYYVEHEYAPYAQEIFGNTPEMMTFFSELFDYPYPWDKYSQMVVRDYVSGAMENTGAVVHLDRAQQKHGQLVDENTWEDVIAHELMHHWFGNLVTSESWPNLSMNEAFANYSEYLWREYKYGKASADEHRFEDLQSYFADVNFNKDLVRFDYEKVQDMFDHVTYNKGGYILHMLRSYLGNDAFFAGLQKYLKDNQYGKAEAHQLRLAMEEVSGRDLNWFFNQWFYGHGHPKMHVIVEKNATTATVHIKQNQKPLFEFPFAIDVYENGKAKRHQVWVEKKTVNTFKFKTNKEADLVLVNADHDLIAEITQDFSAQENANRYLWAKDEYTDRMLALQELSGEQLTSEIAEKTLLAALDDPYDGIREQVLSSIEFSSLKNKKGWLSKVESLANSDPETLVQAAALQNLVSLNDNKYISTFEKALKSESFSVQAAGLLGIMELDKNRALELSEGLEDDVLATSPDLLASLIPYWKSKNDTTHFNIIAELAAFYSFTAMQDPSMAKPAEDAFVWIMSTDSPQATGKVLRLQELVYNQLKESQPMALPYIKMMVERAMKVKTEAAKANPTPSMEKQIEAIQKTLNGMK